jgi:hypothetical protein
MATRTRAPDAVVTGVATGNLGTGTALDDTQVYSVDALATAEHPDAVGTFTEEEPIAAPPPVAGPPPIAALPVAVSPVAASSAAAPSSVAVRPAPTRPLQRQRRITGGYPVGILTAGVVALITVAAVLTMRDGGFVASGGTGPGLAGAASFPPPPSFGPLATAAAPVATRPPKHHGHGHGQDSQ